MIQNKLEPDGKITDISGDERDRILNTVRFLLSVLESYILSKRLGTRQTLILEARLRVRELSSTSLRHSERMWRSLDCLTKLFDSFRGDTDDIEKGILYCNDILEFMDIITLQRSC